MHDLASRLQRVKILKETTLKRVSDLETEVSFLEADLDRGGVDPR
jgi:hypothetical protein